MFCCSHVTTLCEVVHAFCESRESAAMPTMGESTFGESTEYRVKKEHAFYAEWSRRHPPKNRVSLFAQEEMKMQRLRHERSTFGFSEGFTPRRRFPITATESPPAAEEPNSPA